MIGVTQHTEIDFALYNASPALGAVKKKCHDIRRKMEDELGAQPYDHGHATSQFQVTMVSGSLASVSNLEMLNGANLAALIRADGNAELIQFQDIALSEGVYTLTTLLRGRRGTEVFTGGHGVGDLFVLLTGEGVQRRPLPLDRIGDTLFYRAVGRGGELRNARTEQLTLAGNDLKPYAPAQLEADCLRYDSLRRAI
jgi:hypothetical protein